MNLTVKSNIKKMNLSNWEKIFVINYYNGKDKKLPQGLNKIEQIREDINNYLDELYNKKDWEMTIDKNSPEVIRKFDNIVKGKERAGESKNRIQILKNYREEECAKIAKESGKGLFLEYKDRVDLLKNSDYDPAFKAVMLNETLTKVYEKKRNETIIKKRNLNKTISDHMSFSKIILDYLYNNITSIEDYKRNFADYYFASVEEYKKELAEKNIISIKGVETYNKGEWQVYYGEKADKLNYIKNANNLVSLTQDTQWCTKTEAEKHLKEGDYFVFVSKHNENGDIKVKPHIAARTRGDSLAEICGIQNGDSQEIEKEYIDVAISFLENNDKIKNKERALDFLKWNKRLYKYLDDIDNNKFEEKDVKQMLNDYCKPYTGYHLNVNSKLIDLQKKMNNGNVKQKICNYLNCKENDLYIGDFGGWTNGKYFEKDEYKVVIGNVDFSHYEGKTFNKLERIYGDADFKYLKLDNLGSIKMIGRDVKIVNSKIKSFGQLTSIGAELNCDKSKIDDFGDLKKIGGNVTIKETEIKKINNNIELGGVTVCDKSAEKFKNKFKTQYSNIEKNDGNIVVKTVKSIARLVKGIKLNNIFKAKKVLNEITKEKDKEDIDK